VSLDRERGRGKKKKRKKKSLSPVGGDERLLSEELLCLGPRAHGSERRPEALDLRLRAVGDCLFFVVSVFYFVEMRKEEKERNGRNDDDGDDKPRKTKREKQKNKKTAHYR